MNNNEPFTLVFATDADRVQLINILHNGQPNASGEVFVEVKGVNAKVFDPLEEAEVEESPEPVAPVIPIEPATPAEVKPNEEA